MHNCLCILLAAFMFSSVFGKASSQASANHRFPNSASGNCWPLPCKFNETLQRSITGGDPCWPLGCDFQTKLQRSVEAGVGNGTSLRAGPLPGHNNSGSDFGNAGRASGVGVGSNNSGSHDFMGNAVGESGSQPPRGQKGAIVDSFSSASGFSNGFTQSVRGNEKLGYEERPVGSFSGVSVGSTVFLHLSQSAPTGKVRLEGETNILPLFDVSVQSDGVLVIRAKPRGPEFKARYTIKAYASSNVLNKLIVGDASKILMATGLNASSLTINATGASEVRIPSGQVESLVAMAEGGSMILAFGLQSERANATATGVAAIYLSASKSLAASVSRVSQVRYRGSPKLGPMYIELMSTVARVT